MNSPKISGLLVLVFLTLGFSGGCDARQDPATGAPAGSQVGSQVSSLAENGGPVTAAMMPERGRVSDAEYAEYVLKLQQRLGDQGYTILLEKPFVVIGNEEPEVVRQRCERTIHWAVEKLKADYFEVDPDHIIEIWLFGDKDSYDAGCESLIGRAPTTPFGFYSAAEKKLIMNIATGGGTLVHEIVHPFMAANFPGCPSWFNEGLASLYEQCDEVDGHIAGKTNWRLRGLQLAIADQRLPGFGELMTTTTREFYGDDRGTNYAQARYLCYWLQQQGLLHQFYHEFRAASADDPTGVTTLKAVLKNDDLVAFQESWQEWILQLRF